MSYRQRLLTLRKHLKLTQTEMANALGIRQPVVHDYEKGRTSPSVELIHKIASVYNCNLHWLITGEGEMFISQDADKNLSLFEIDKRIDEKVTTLIKSQFSYYGNQQFSDTANRNEFWYLKVKGDIACGDPMPLTEDISEQLIPISKATLPNPDQCDILRVNGDSMYPEIEHSDLVVIRQETNWENCNNKIVAVRNDDGITLKKLVIDTNKRSAQLIPSNRKYFPILVDESCVLCGYLILLVRRY